MISSSKKELDEVDELEQPDEPDEPDGVSHSVKSTESVKSTKFVKFSRNLTETYTITVQPVGKGPPAVVRLRRLLKKMLRQYGLKAIDITAAAAKGMP